MIQWSSRVTPRSRPRNPHVDLHRTAPRRHCSLCRCPCHRLCLWPFPHQMPCHPAFPQTPVGSSSPSRCVSACRIHSRSCWSYRLRASSAGLSEPFFTEPLSPLALRRGGVNASTSIGAGVEPMCPLSRSSPVKRRGTTRSLSAKLRGSSALPGSAELGCPWGPCREGSSA